MTDSLTAALLPVLLHKLNNATQLLTGLHAVLSSEGGQQLVLERSEHLGQAGRMVEELGWCLAVLASAEGTDLLLSRREPEGLGILLGLLADGERRAGRALHLPPELPRLAPGALDGWQVPWAAAALLHAAGADAQPVTLEVESGGGGALLRGPAGPALRALAPEVERRLPGAELEVGSDAFALRLPPHWCDGESRAP